MAKQNKSVKANVVSIKSKAKKVKAVLCTKCGRDNGRPNSPSCRNADACKARRAEARKAA